MVEIKKGDSRDFAKLGFEKKRHFGGFRSSLRSAE
jgi:hypothetical protein